jgi:hypothetical protein
MKKIIGIVVLSLLLNSNVNAKDKPFCILNGEGVLASSYLISEMNTNSICDGMKINKYSDSKFYQYLRTIYNAKLGLNQIPKKKLTKFLKVSEFVKKEVIKTNQTEEKTKKVTTELADIDNIKEENAKLKKKLKKEKLKIAKQNEILKREILELEEKKNKEDLSFLRKNTDEKYYALVIGNNKYEHLQNLDAAENDARVISDVLRKNYGFEVELLLNADYDKTVNSLHKISKKLTKNDNLLIFYAGHGELDKKQNRGYWLPVDASHELRSKWISNAIIADEIKATEAKHVLLIVDSCFAGSLMRSSSEINSKKKLDSKYIKLLKKKKTRLVITSGGNEPVMDSDGGEHSLFAKKFIETLKENKSVITTQKIFEDIKKYVAVNADQTPERAAIYKAGHDGGDFLFFAKNN